MLLDVTISNIGLQLSNEQDDSQPQTAIDANGGASNLFNPPHGQSATDSNGGAMDDSGTTASLDAVNSSLSDQFYGGLPLPLLSTIYYNANGKGQASSPFNPPGQSATNSNGAMDDSGTTASLNAVNSSLSDQFYVPPVPSTIYYDANGEGQGSNNSNGGAMDDPGTTASLDAVNSSLLDQFYGGLPLLSTIYYDANGEGQGSNNSNGGAMDDPGTTASLDAVNSSLSNETRLVYRYY